MPAAGPFRNAGPALAGERGPLAPRTFLPDFADERNRALDGKIRVRDHRGGQASRSAGAGAHPPPAPPLLLLFHACCRPACMSSIALVPSCTGTGGGAGEHPGVPAGE